MSNSSDQCPGPTWSSLLPSLSRRTFVADPETGGFVLHGRPQAGHVVAEVAKVTEQHAVILIGTINHH